MSAASFVFAVVKQNLPKYWEEVSYGTNLYISVFLNVTSEEFLNLEAEFLVANPDAVVSEIERIQNPYAFARFCIRKEHLQVTQEPIQRRQFWAIFNPSRIDEILTHNCDFRKGGFSEHQSDLKRANYALVVQTLGLDPDERDSHRYPEYIVTYKNPNPAAEIPDCIEKLQNLTL